MADDQVNTQTTENSQVEEQAPALPPIVAPPSEEESETETGTETESESEQQEEVHTTSHLVVPRHQIVWQYTQYAGIQAVLWLQILWNLLSSMASTTHMVGKGVVRSLQEKTYVFFKGSSYPYRIQDLNLLSPGVGPIEWYYDADKKLFLAGNLYNTTTEYTTHHLEWLSGQIRYNNLVLYDISDFLQQTRWAGQSRPSISCILAAWSLGSGVVLNQEENITLLTINEDGTESTLRVHA